MGEGARALLDKHTFAVNAQHGNFQSKTQDQHPARTHANIDVAWIKVKTMQHSIPKLGFGVLGIIGGVSLGFLAATRHMDRLGHLGRRSVPAMSASEGLQLEEDPQASKEDSAAPAPDVKNMVSFVEPQQEEAVKSGRAITTREENVRKVGGSLLGLYTAFKILQHSLSVGTMF